MSSLNSNRCYLVMWPDDQDTASAGGQGSRTTQQPVGPAPHSPPKTLVRINGRSSSTSSDEGNVEVSANQQSLIPVARLAYHPVLVSREYQDIQSNTHDDSPPTTIIRTNSQRVFPEAMLDGGTFVTVSTPSGGSTNNLSYDQCCSKCLLKDSENRHLRKRIQGLEEQLCRAIGNKKPKLISSMESAVIALTPQSIPVRSQIRNQMSTAYTVGEHSVIEAASQAGGSGNTVQLYSSSKLHTVEQSQLHSFNSTSGTNANNNAVRAREKQTDDDKIELVPGTNVFISTSKLQQILSVVKTGKQLARKLMSIYWDRVTLARSTLSASSQHYEQLDPSIISAIKTYCVLFDSSSRKSEIHSTMIDKCVQARRPRRSSLRQVDPITSGGYKPDQASSPGVNLHPPREGGAFRVAVDQRQRTEDVPVPTSIVNIRREDLNSPIMQHTSMLETRDDDSSTNVSREDDSPDPIYRVTQDVDSNNGTIIVPRLINVPHNFRDPVTHSNNPVVHQFIDDNVYTGQSRDRMNLEGAVRDAEDDQTLIIHVTKEGDNLSSSNMITTTSLGETIVTHSPLVHQLRQGSLLSSITQQSKPTQSSSTSKQYDDTIMLEEEDCSSMLVDLPEDVDKHNAMIHQTMSDTSSPESDEL